MISRSLIPNAFTSLNLAFGILSIIKSIESDYFLAGVFILLAMLADAFDGRTARYFGVSGDFGKELDSLCDVVSFGVSPAILMYQMHFVSTNSYVYLCIVIVFAVCAALRLARFNIDTQNIQGYFMGMPSPAAGCFLATFAISGLMFDKVFIAIGILITGLLMYSTVRYPDFKGKGNPIRKPFSFLALIFATYLIYLLPLIAIPFIVFLAYILMGILNFFYVKVTGGY